MTSQVAGERTETVVADPAAPAQLLLRQLRADETGLTSRDAQRRLLRYGPNELHRRGGRRWPGELLAQFTHPLALLLWAAGGLAFVAGTPVLGWTILAVVVLNAGFAFVQEMQAERAVEALRRYLPQRATVLRDRAPAEVDVVGLVPGDVLVLTEGERVPLLAATDLVFSGTTCTAGEARALVYATGDHTELGRIAALSQRVERDQSPLEQQVKRVAKLIAVVAVAVGVTFLPLGLLAGLSLKDAFLFAVGLLVANVPEGLLPTITLALAVGVRVLARQGAVVKRLSAVETLGSTTVICSDKTGTITENRMHPVALWAGGREVDLGVPTSTPATSAMAAAMAACTTVAAAADGALHGDPTELAVVEAARLLGGSVEPDLRDHRRRHLYAFDPERRRMSTVDAAPAGLVLHVKGAPEAVVGRCATVLRDDGVTGPLDERAAWAVWGQVSAYTRRGLRVLAVADRALDAGPWPDDPEQAEAGLRLLGLVALLDPPRPEVAPAVRRCHSAGLRIHVITGDNGETAAEIARQVGIGAAGRRVVTAADLDGMSDAELDAVFTGPDEVICARSSPEEKLRIADVLRDAGDVVAMTGDGVNDAPALRRADIGVAMGRSGTDVAREAATMVLADDNFATIVVAVQEGRRVYDNVRKFILYIFAHAVPEVVPFLVFALSGGAIPLPLTVLQILAIDLGTETLPALALGREPGEPGLMERRPRPRGESVVTRGMLARAWGLLGGVSAVLVLGAFAYTLLRAGWHPGDDTGSGAPLHHAYLQATTATFAGIVACQVGTALAARTEHAALRDVGLFTNPMLLWGIAFELVFTAVLVYLPAAQDLMGTAALSADVLAVIAPFPLVVWGVDEWRRARRRRSLGPGRSRSSA